MKEEKPQVVIGKKENNKSLLLKIILVLTVFSVLIASVFIFYRNYQGKKENKEQDTAVEYKTLEDSIKSGMDPDRVRSLENYDKALSLYGEEDYSGSVKIIEEELNKKIDPDVQPGFYALLYNCYLKLNQLDNAKSTIYRYKKSESYKTLGQSSKNQWDYQLKVLEEGKVPDPNARQTDG